MSYLFVEMIWYLLAALLLGLVLGWMIWGWRTRQAEKAVVDPGAERLAADLEAGRSELARLRGELATRDSSLREAEARASALASQLEAGAPTVSGGGAADTAQVATLQARVSELEAALASAGAQAAAPGATQPGAEAAQVTTLKARVAELETAMKASAPAGDGGGSSEAAAAPVATASLADELARAQKRAGLAEQGLRDLRRSAAGAVQAEAEHKALQARVDQLEDDLADARRLAELSGGEAPAESAQKLELDELKAELERHTTARQTLVADLEEARTRASAAEQELAALRAAAAESDAEVGAASPQPLLTPSNTDADDGDPDDAPAQAGGEVDPDAVGDKPALLEGPREGGPDDLKKIKGVGPKLEEILHDLGVYHFDQIAAWTEREIAWVDARLRFRGRVNRDGWIDQATKLAAGEETEFSKKVDKGGVYD